MEDIPIREIPLNPEQKEIVKRIREGQLKLLDEWVEKSRAALNKLTKP